MSFDFGSLFAEWSEASVATAAPSVSVRGLLVGIYPSRGTNSLVNLQVRLSPESEEDSCITRALAVATNPETLTFSLNAADVAAGLVAPLDTVVVHGCYERTLDDGRVFLNARSVERVTPWTQNVATLAQEHVPLPLPVAGMGKPFVIYSGPSVFRTFPGLHRQTTSPTWLSVTYNGKRCLDIEFQQRQWSTKEELAGGNVPSLRLSARLWDSLCCELPGGGLTGSDLALWQQVMPHHMIPFWAACGVELRYTKPDKIALKVLSVQWDLVPYLERHALPVPLETMQQIFPEHTKGKAKSVLPPAGVVSVTAMKQLPQSPSGWRYYALTSDPLKIRDMDALLAHKATSIFLGVPHAPTAGAAARPSTSKKLKASESQHQQGNV